jgi:hypothetical protein
LRDYSQAVDVGTLKGVPSDTIRLLLWVLAFMTFGYATAEFEVTSERLGCYRPEGIYPSIVLVTSKFDTSQSISTTRKDMLMVKMLASMILVFVGLSHKTSWPSTLKAA